MEHCSEKKIFYMKELLEGPKWIQDMLDNEEFKPKMKKHLDNMRVKKLKLKIG